jgi:hypothetical protein
MPNKQKIIKLFIFSLIIFTLLTNLIYLVYEKSYESGDYQKYNNEVINYYINSSDSIPLEVKHQNICSNLKGPLGSFSVYYKLTLFAILMIVVSIIVVFLLLILKMFKKIIISYQDIIIFISIILVSFFIFIWAFVFEPDYYFSYCVYF